MLSIDKCIAANALEADCVFVYGDILVIALRTRQCRATFKSLIDFSALLPYIYAAYQEKMDIFY